MIGQLIYGLLSADADVSALVSDRIFPMMAIEDDQEPVVYPYITWESSGTEPTDQKDSPSQLDVVSYDISIWSKEISEVNDLALKVRNVLDRYSGTNSGVEVQSVTFIDEELGYNDIQGRVYLKMQEYSFRYCTIYGVLSPATSLTATAISTSEIDLAWTDNSTGETGFEVSRSLDCENWSLITTTIANATAYSDTGLATGTAYIYRVRPTDGTNGSAWSNLAAGCTNSAGTPASGIAYSRPTPTGQQTTYATGDDGDNLTSGVYDITGPASPASYANLDSTATNPFLTLSSVNAFGTLFRFTDSAGGQNFDGTGGSIADYVIDHYTGLGWYRVIQSTGSWTVKIAAGQSATFATFSDWRVPSQTEQDSLFFYEPTFNSLDYTPFNDAVANNLVTSTTAADSTTLFITIANTTGVVSRFAKTAAIGAYYLCRNHY